MRSLFEIIFSLVPVGLVAASALRYTEGDTDKATYLLLAAGILMLNYALLQIRDAIMRLR